MTDQDTDPIPEEDDPAYGFWATLFGLPLLERRLVAQFEWRLIGLGIRLDRIEQLLAASATDQEALEAAARSLRDADATIDHIEPAPFNNIEKGTP